MDSPMLSALYHDINIQFVRIEYLLSFWEFPSKLTDYSAKNHQCD
jgi:hypothetical protein